MAPVVIATASIIVSYKLYVVLTEVGVVSPL